MKYYLITFGLLSFCIDSIVAIDEDACDACVERGCGYCEVNSEENCVCNMDEYRSGPKCNGGGRDGINSYYKTNSKLGCSDEGRALAIALGIAIPILILCCCFAGCWFFCCRDRRNNNGTNNEVMMSSDHEEQAYAASPQEQPDSSSGSFQKVLGPMMSAGRVGRNQHDQTTTRGDSSSSTS